MSVFLWISRGSLYFYIQSTISATNYVCSYLNTIHRLVNTSPQIHKSVHCGVYLLCTTSTEYSPNTCLFNAPSTADTHLWHRGLPCTDSPFRLVASQDSGQGYSNHLPVCISTCIHSMRSTVGIQLERRGGGSKATDCSLKSIYLYKPQKNIPKI